MHCHFANLVTSAFTLSWTACMPMSLFKRNAFRKLCKHIYWLEKYVKKQTNSETVNETGCWQSFIVFLSLFEIPHRNWAFKKQDLRSIAFFMFPNFISFPALWGKENVLSKWSSWDPPAYLRGPRWKCMSWTRADAPRSCLLPPSPSWGPRLGRGFSDAAARGRALVSGRSRQTSGCQCSTGVGGSGVSPSPAPSLWLRWRWARRCLRETHLGNRSRGER